ncbi:MAG: iron-sulfur cluster repair protein YtfE [marine bacterium B5-7]|nr:MAG: iron-sulfur cluster repair protein YtfE [marine bacterium B5-7]
MNTLDLTLGQIVQKIPGSTAVFSHYQLDYCRDGNKTLQEAARQHELNVDNLINAFENLAENNAAFDQNCAEATDDVLIKHIVSRYHDIHRQQLPELIRLAQRVEQVHGEHPRCPKGLSTHLEKMQSEMDIHMHKEEQVLFPMIIQGTHEMIAGPIAMMRHEHEEHTTALAELDIIADHIQLPEDACNTWHALYTGLITFKADLLDHIDLENNILFQRIDSLNKDVHHG